MFFFCVFYPKSKIRTKLKPFKCGLYHKQSHKNTSAALRSLKMKKTRLGYKSNPVTMKIIRDKTEKEILEAALREILEKQGKKIQRMR